MGRSDGCDIWDKCLECPLPECRFDSMKWSTFWHKIPSFIPYIELKGQGYTNTEICQMLGIRGSAIRRCLEDTLNHKEMVLAWLQKHSHLVKNPQFIAQTVKQMKKGSRRLLVTV